MLAGTRATPGSLLVNGTLVLAAAAMLRVSVSEPLAPCVSVSAEGSRLARVGGAESMTLTVVRALPRSSSSSSPCLSSPPRLPLLSRRSSSLPL